MSGDFPDKVAAMKARILELAADYNKPDAYRTESVDSAMPEHNNYIWESGKYCFKEHSELITFD